MEAVAVLGAGAYLASALFAQPPHSRKVNPSPEEEFEAALMRPEEMQFKNAQYAGMWRPPYQSVTTRLPWGQGGNAPYYVHRPGQSHLDSPVTQLYTQLINATAHQRKDFQEQLVASRQQYSRPRASAIYQGFSNEMKLPDNVSGGMRQTQHMNWSWMPKDPTDSDFNDAALLAKVLPPDPLLFTPEADFATAPGLSFRYAPY